MGAKMKANSGACGLCAVTGPMKNPATKAAIPRTNPKITAYRRCRRTLGTWARMANSPHIIETKIAAAPKSAAEEIIWDVL